ncbi:MAG: 3-phosphoshikimate 1-carboxyvinyltransferase [Micromonosporaceae bacterium]|nr:3-phosphoshikimate 1-carboxyvinyltransferase [Micromonosporaceae bacterium]
MTEARVPGSKSITARALFLAACGDGVTTLRRPLWADDTEGFAEGLSRLGYGVEQRPDEWLVRGSPSGPPSEEASVHTRDAATASRFLPALAAAGRGRYRFDASAQMRRRPVGPLIAALRALGVDVSYDGAEGHLPLTVVGRGVDGGAVTLDAGLSSQFLTALLLAGPLTAKGLDITVSGMVSVPYVELTIAMMRRFGADVAVEGDTFRVAPGGYRARSYEIEPDASTASYFFAAAALLGRTVTVPGLGRDSLQGDLRFVEVLSRMGASVEIGAGATTVTGPERLSGITVNMRDISDTMPTLAAIAPHASGPVRIEDVYNTRVKECDRLDACAENLRSLGVRVETGRDWIEIWPGEPRPAEIACRGDHRIAMSFSVAGLRAPGIALDDPGCVKKTFPEFHEALAALRRDWSL